ncbi:hypothetical protein [uncultured Eubacterium sp.]|uniref:hypothetical protein n=1 Tax=uncultured Eubacterium sp. TaxID=165185 RepID=UPI0026218EF8|nr:hypothetical protein [uncultured Eubacterium sp.]
MKKSFKRIVAVLLAVMMIVCSFPLTVLAADSNRTNINLRFGDVSNKATPKNYNVERRGASIDDFVNYSGLNSTKLDYSNGKIAGYSKGDFFTVSVLVENVSKIAAAEVAIKYSDSISPAYIKNVNSGTAVVEYTEGKPAIEGFQPLEAITKQSGDAIHNKTHTLGETSYVDADKKIIHAKFATQEGSDYADTSSITAGKQKLTNTAVLATFMFKIVSDGAITFTLDTPEEAYYLETIANGGKVNEYKTYVPKSQGAEAELDFMGKNEYNGSTSTSYTITFNDENGKVLQTGSYEEGTDVIAPALPAVAHDDEKHYTYSWDKKVVSPAAADATYTRVKTGAVHTWNDGVVTKEPTTTETGIKTYTCTFDGCGATKTETLPKKEESHVHHYTWKYDDSALYYNKLADRHDGELVGTCECGDVKREAATNTSLLRCNSYALVLDSSLTVNFKMTKKNVASFSNVVVKANTAFKGEIEYTAPDKEDATYNQYLVGVWPQNVKDDIDVVAYSTMKASDGTVVEVWGPTYTRSVKIYTDSILGSATYTGANAKAKNKALATICVNILNYAAAAQVYSNTNVNELANAGLTDAQKALATPDVTSFETVKNYAAVPIDNPSARFAGAALSLEDAVVPKMTIALRNDVNINDITVKATVAGQTFEYNPVDDAAQFKVYKTNVSGALGKENRYYFYFPGVFANQMKETIQFAVYDKSGKQISAVCTYSVESYVQQAYGLSSSSASFKNLLMSIMKYGVSAKAYGEL